MIASGRSAHGSWGVARFRILSYYKKTKRDGLVFNAQTLESIASVGDEVEEEISERREALDICLDKIKRRGRNVLEMRYLEDLSISDIADKVGGD